jgi:hypothetical protein
MESLSMCVWAPSGLPLRIYQRAGHEDFTTMLGCINDKAPGT